LTNTRKKENNRPMEGGGKVIIDLQGWGETVGVGVKLSGKLMGPDNLGDGVNRR